MHIFSSHYGCVLFDDGNVANEYNMDWGCDDDKTNTSDQRLYCRV